MAPNSNSSSGELFNSSPKEVGEQVPGFELPGASEDGIETFALENYTDEGAVILSFYPFDFSPICTNQLCGFRDAEWLTFTENVDVFGISVDSAYCHQRFREEYNLSFPLLTDRVASVAEEFGVTCDEWENHPTICQRSLFAIDDTHTIRYRWIPESPTDAPSIGELEDMIEWIDP